MNSIQCPLGLGLSLAASPVTKENRCFLVVLSMARIMMQLCRWLCAQENCFEYLVNCHFPPMLVSLLTAKKKVSDVLS